MYPSLYYAIKDLFGMNLPFLKMVQSFGFFVAVAFLISSYILTKEFKRKEQEGLLTPQKIKVLKGAKASVTDYIVSGILGFVFKPTEEQQRPLEPQPGAGGDAHDDHGHHH